MLPPTKWTGLPLPETGSVSTDITDWGWFYQFWLAIREREQVNCARYFPHPSKIWDGGVISTLTNTELTDSTRIPFDADEDVTVADGGDSDTLDNDAPSWHCNDASLEDSLKPDWLCCNNFSDSFENGQDEWIDRCAVWPDFPGECNPAVPRDYEVIIGADLFTEPYKIKVSRIRSNGMYTLRFDDLGLEPSELAALVGKRYEIVRLGGGDLFWHKHIPYANPATLWRGNGDLTVPTISSSSSGNGTFTITDHVTSAPWEPLWDKDQFKGKKVAIQSSIRGGYPRFGTITHNDQNSFTFTLPNGYFPSSGVYAIMRDANPQRYSFSLPECTPFVWHTQYQTGFWSADSTITAAPNFQFPKTSIQVGNENCDGFVSKPLMDNDFRTDFDQDCPGEFPADVPDNIISPDLFKSWRGLQAWVEQNCAAWTPAESYNGKVAVHHYVVAYLFFKAGINSLPVDSATIDPTDPDNVYVTALNHGVPEPIAVYYAIEYADDWVGSGVFWAGSGETKVPFGAAHTLAVDGVSFKYAGAKVYLSYGWTRRVGRHFRFMYDRPYLDPDTGETGAALGPGPTSPGQWLVRPKSTTYAKSNDNFLPDNNFNSDAADVPGTFADSLIGHTEDSTEVFVSGEFAHYFGHNWQGTTTEWSTSGVSQSYADVIIKGQFEGQTPIDLGHHVVGNLTAVGTGWIRDDEQDWNLWGEWDGFTGTATGGSNTSLQCSTVFGPDPDYMGGGTPPNIFLDQRWQASTGRWIGFVVSILTGPFTGQKAIITGFNESAFEITFSLPSFSDETGPHSFNWQYTDHTGAHPVQFKIHEPKHRDRWAGRQIEVTDLATGAKHTGTIDHSDNNTIWFSGLGYTPRKRDEYRILDAQVGYTYKWDGSKWLSVPKGWAEKVTTVTRYGRANKCDYWQAKNINEVYRCINLLRSTQGDFSWKSKGELNVSTGNATGEGRYVEDKMVDGVLHNGTDTDAENQYFNTDINPFANSDNAPFASYFHSESRFKSDCTTLISNAAQTLIQRQYAYGYISGICTLINHSTDFYARAVGPLGNATLAPDNEYGYTEKFSDDGDGVGFNVLGLVKSGSPTNSADEYSPKVGDVSLQLPTEPRDLALDGVTWCSGGKSDSAVIGYQVVDQKAVINWVGLQFVD